jgi:hypothetical protein
MSAIDLHARGFPRNGMRLFELALYSLVLALLG